MTTPAINQSQTYSVDGYIYKVYPDETVTSGPFPRLHRASSRYRPESVNSPFVLPSRRMPTHWVHDSSYLRLPLYSVAEDQLGTPWYRYSTNNATFSYGIPTIGAFDDTLYVRAVNGCLAKLKDQKVDLSVAFAERNRTAALFSDSMTRVSRETDRWKRKNGSLWEKVKRLNPRLDRYPKLWLAFQYGLKPLVDDLAGLVYELNVRDHDLPKRYFLTVTKTIHGGSSRPRTDLMYHTGNPACPLIASEDVEELCHVSLTYSLMNPAIQQMSQVGLTNPFSLAWELLPFSFILDWALPIGNYLNSLDADFGWRYELGSAGRLKKVRIVGQSQVLADGYTLISGDPTEYRYKSESFSRFVLYSSPWPIFPGLKSPFSSTHVANALSLLASSYR